MKQNLQQYRFLKWKELKNLTQNENFLILKFYSRCKKNRKPRHQLEKKIWRSNNRFILIYQISNGDATFHREKPLLIDSIRRFWGRIANYDLKKNHEHRSFTHDVKTIRNLLDDFLVMLGISAIFITNLGSNSVKLTTFIEIINESTFFKFLLRL